jgi:hypothetical protein
MHYYRNLKVNPPPRRNESGKTEENNIHKLSSIFHWSCVEYQANRFSIFESGREMLETTADVTAHTAGFYLAFQMLESIWYKIAVFVIMFIMLNRRMLQLKYFLTDPKMMPLQLRRLFPGLSTTRITD